VRPRGLREKPVNWFFRGAVRVAADPRKSRRLPTSITLDANQRADLRLIADRRLSSVSQTVRELIQEGIERRKRDEARADAH
jgi:hypothetical protein